jgi:hypothetical protein
MSMVTRPSEQNKISQKTMQISFILSSLEPKTDQNQKNTKPDLLKTDRRSVFTLLKTDRLWSRSGFPAGPYTSV